VALGMPPSSPISDPGNLYLGANMELPNEALSLCVHGEQSAVNHALIQQKLLSIVGTFGKTLSLMLGSRQRRASKEVSSFLFGKRQSL
jgi:hypothetical protein